MALSAYLHTWHWDRKLTEELTVSPPIMKNIHRLEAIAGRLEAIAISLEALCILSEELLTIEYDLHYHLRFNSRPKTTKSPTPMPDDARVFYCTHCLVPILTSLIFNEGSYKIKDTSTSVSKSFGTTTPFKLDMDKCTELHLCSSNYRHLQCLLRVPTSLFPSFSLDLTKNFITHSPQPFPAPPADSSWHVPQLHETSQSPTAGFCLETGIRCLSRAQCIVMMSKNTGVSM